MKKLSDVYLHKEDGAARKVEKVTPLMQLIF